MTLRAAGKIEGRAFAIRPNEKGWVCLACMQETKPNRSAFERHRCGKETAEEPPKTTSRKRSAAQTPTPTADGDA